MVKKKKVDPQTERNRKEVGDFFKKHFEDYPHIADPANPTEDEIDALVKWNIEVNRRTERFFDKNLSPEEVTAKYKRTPEVNAELEAIGSQLRATYESLTKLADTGAHQEYFQLEVEFEQLVHRRYDLMEKRGSPYDKTQAKIMKKAWGRAVKQKSQ